MRVILNLLLLFVFHGTVNGDLTQDQLDFIRDNADAVEAALSSNSRRSEVLLYIVHSGFRLTTSC